MSERVPVRECRREVEGYRCGLVSENRDPLQAEIERLAKENAQLRERLARAGDGQGMKPPPDPAFLFGLYPLDPLLESKPLVHDGRSGEGRLYCLQLSNERSSPASYRERRSSAFRPAAALAIIG
jgi:hypothetical protein